MKRQRVIIVGGGPAGAAISIGLARHGFKPVVVEALDEPEAKVGECLPPSSATLLERLRLKKQLHEQGHLPSYGIRSVWGSPVPVERDFLFGTTGHGWHLDRRRFEEELAASSRDAGTEWRCGCRVVAADWQEGKWVLSLRRSGLTDLVEADFLVDATGRPARIARQLGAKQARYDRLVGAAVLMGSGSGTGIKDTFTLVEAVRGGWWYSGPLPGGRLMVIYMSDGDLMDNGAVRHKDGWTALLDATDHTFQRVREGDYSPIAGPHILPANSTRLDKITGERWLAAGDAAVSYDPLSSYGISSAMGGGLHAADAIAEYLEGDQSAVPAYGMMLEKAYAHYLALHCAHYSIERRWADEPFWSRRHSPSFGKRPISVEPERDIQMDADG